ncbi:ABC transporter permease [Rhizobium ruizarguesonis]|uniref:ABC transporter permease n=1 Tax=Rhizobium ruizarguesonis TaxID=2081791 RepID=UPI003712F6FC
MKLYTHYVRLSVAAQLQYRTAFYVQVVGHFASSGIGFLGVWTLLARFGNFDGWGPAQVSVLYGLINIAFAIAEAFGRGFDAFGTDFIRTGEFDRLLVRPRSTILQLLGHEVRLRSLGRLSQGLVVLIFGLSANGGINIFASAVCLWCIIGGVALFIGLFVFQATLSFWTIETLEILNVFTYGGVQAAQYPMSIYANWIRSIFTYVIPFAAVTYYPALVIIQPERFGHHLIFVASPVLGIAFLMVALIFFSIGVRRYVSAGG